MYNFLSPPEILKDLLTPRVLIIPVAALVKVLRVTNGVVLESQGFGRPVYALTFVHYLPEELPQSPAAVALFLAYVNA